MHRPNHRRFGPELWEPVRHTRPAIKARATLLLYTTVVSIPFVALIAVAAHLLGLRPHEVIGVACYHAMLTCLFMFDSLRNASHYCFSEAWDMGKVLIREGVPVIDTGYRYRRLAGLSFAIGGHGPGGDES